MAKTKELLNGSHAKMYLNSSLVAWLQSASAKVEGDFEELSMCGDTATYQVPNGSKGTGTMKLKRTTSAFTHDVATRIQNMQEQDYTIVQTIPNPNTGKTERIQLLGVVFTEATLFDYESKKIMEMDMPFTFTKFQYLDRIK